MIVSSVTKFLLLFWKYRLNLRVHLFNPFVLSLSKDSLINFLIARAALSRPTHDVLMLPSFSESILLSGVRTLELLGASGILAKK